MLFFCCPSSSDSTNSMSRVSRRKKKLSEGFHISGKSVRLHWGDYSLVEADVDWVSGDTDLVIGIWWYRSGDTDLVLGIFVIIKPHKGCHH